MVAVAGVEYGPGLAAAAVLLLSLLAKLMMSFGVRVKEPPGGYESLADGAELKKRAENTSKAQLNVAEYEALFITIFVFFHLQSVDGICVTIVTVAVPLAQLIYFWGRALTGAVLPWAPIGALTRYICLMICIYVLYNEIMERKGAKFTYGPGLAAVVQLTLCLLSKMAMTARRDPGKNGEFGDPAAAENASKAQLNVKEYDALIIALFLFLYMQKSEGLLVTILCYAFPIAQAVYFWGRSLSGNVLPWAPAGALPRYICLLISIYVVYQEVSKDGTQYGPGYAAWVCLILCTISKMAMTARRNPSKNGEFDDPEKAKNASKAQLNVAEYDDLFFELFVFYYLTHAEGLLVTILCYLMPAAQAVYFWGRVLSGNMMPWAPMGAIPRYLSIGISVYLMTTSVMS